VTGEVVVTAERDPGVERPSADPVLHGELQHF